MDWIATKVTPTPQQWTNWKAPNSGLPEALVRLYLTQQLEGEEAYHVRLQRLREEKARQDATADAEAKRQRAAPKKVGREKRRAAG